VKDIIKGVEAIQVEERGRDPTIPIATVFDLVFQNWLMILIENVQRLSQTLTEHIHVSSGSFTGRYLQLAQRRPAWIGGRLEFS
jgi:hypothetical protein